MIGGDAVAERYKISVNDALIVAMSLVAGWELLCSEDMDAGLRVENQLRILNLYKPGELNLIWGSLCERILILKYEITRGKLLCDCP